MRVLHLFSNYKWTGPAEPALNLCAGLKTAGVDLTFACGPGKNNKNNKVAETACERGIEPVLSFYLGKHRNPIKNFYDSRALHKMLKGERYDLIHCHMDNDHEIAFAAARNLGIPIVRSNYHGEGLPLNRPTKKMIKSCAYLLEPSRLASANDIKHFGIPAEKLHVVPGAVDIRRFNPERELPDMRKRLNIPAESFVIGIVARMQRHRHYEDLFSAFKQLADYAPNAHLLVVGRGTYQESVGFQPVKDLGLEGRVTFSGFIDGDDYVGALRAMDAGVYLVPGSDGTCRTVRELMAMGLPVIVAQRGMLPEITENGVEGVHFDNSVAGLFGAFKRLHDNKDERKKMGAAAKEKARAAYSIEAQAQTVLEIYRQILN